MYINNPLAGERKITPLETNMSVYRIYTWEGKTPKESYETYLIKEYTPQWLEHLEQYRSDVIEKERLQTEIANWNKKRNTLKKQDTLPGLQLRLEKYEYIVPLEVRMYNLEAERNVNRAISEGKVWDERTNNFVEVKKLWCKQCGEIM